MAKGSMSILVSKGKSSAESCFLQVVSLVIAVEVLGSWNTRLVLFKPCSLLVSSFLSFIVLRPFSSKYLRFRTLENWLADWTRVIFPVHSFAAVAFVGLVNAE